MTERNISENSNKFDVKIKKYTVEQAVWIATALLSLELYEKKPDAKEEDYYFRQYVIANRAQCLTNGNVDSGRCSKWYCADADKAQHYYLRGDNTQDTSLRRLTRIDEYPEKTYPDNLNMEDVLPMGNHTITMSELFDFVKNVYPKMFEEKNKTMEDLLREFVKRFIEEYPVEKTKGFGSNIFGHFIRSEVPERIYGTGIVNRSRYAITGSVGQENWARIPWVAIFDKEITTSAQNGEYIVYLLSQDQKTLYLTFNQGCTELKAQYGKNETLNILKEKVKEIRSIIPNRGFSGSGIDLHSPDDDKAQMYEEGCIYSKAYNIDHLPEEAELRQDLENMIKIYQEFVEHERTMRLEAYDPGITKEMWLEVLQLPEIYTGVHFRFLRYIYEVGGYANNVSYDSKYCMDRVNEIGKKVSETFDINPFEKDGNQYWFSIPLRRENVIGDKGSTYQWSLRTELMEALEEMLTEKKKTFEYPKNMILYGPPGTGKTYNTVIYSVAICEDKSIEEVENTPYNEVMERYEKLKKENRIAFTTFHQSYGYEEFIEGIKPVVDEDVSKLEYKIESGIFKRFCEYAKTPEELEVDPNTQIWFVRLNTDDAHINKEQCYKYGEIRFDKSKERQLDEDKTFQERFVDSMRIGDYVVSYAKQGIYIDGVGVITGEAVFNSERKSYQWTRKVQWLYKGSNIDIKEINGNHFLPNQLITKMTHLKLSDLLTTVPVFMKKNKKPYVFIIDEINRGNISKIFGELITLIEDTKREGMKEQASAILPYSGDNFSVPENVYILGTMNTADRSIALMDTALRRRFRFIEKMPDSDVLRKIGADEVENLDVAKMLETINERISFLYDREHTIGHAFFTELSENPTIECLKTIFKESVIPLLQEYFYEDYQKIQLVLGDNGKTDPTHKFISDEEIKIKSVFKGHAEDVVDLPEKKYSINEAAFDIIDSYKEIM